MEGCIARASGNLVSLSKAGFKKCNHDLVVVTAMGLAQSCVVVSATFMCRSHPRASEDVNKIKRTVFGVSLD
jgi:hypothetical protein